MNSASETIPNHWKIEPLGKVCREGGGSIQTGPFGSQLHADDYVEDGVPIITVEHLRDGKISDANLPLVGERDYQRLSRYTLAKGDLVFSRVGSIDRCSYVGEKQSGWLFSGRCLRVRPGRGKAVPEFLAYLLNSWGQRQWILNHSVGSTMACLNTSILSGVPIELPPSDEQRRIATILTTLDEVIEATEKLVEKHQQIKAGLMHDLFTRGLWTRPELARGDHRGSTSGASAKEDQLRPTPEDAPELYQDSPRGLIPKEWTFGPLAAFLNGRPKNGYSPQEVSEWSGLLALGLGCLTREGFSPHHLKTVGAGSIACNDALLADGDLLISRSNTRELVGLCGIYRDVGFPCIYPDLMMRIRPNGRTSARYLEELLLSPLMRNQITGAAVGTSGSMVKLNSRSVLGLELAIPSSSEQESILDVIGVQKSAIETQTTHLAKLRQQKQGLMHDLLTGRVRVSD